MLNRLINYFLRQKKEKTGSILDVLPCWQIELTEHIDYNAGQDDPVLKRNLEVIKDQTGLNYEDLLIEKGADGFAVISPKTSNPKTSNPKISNNKANPINIQSDKRSD